MKATDVSMAFAYKRNDSVHFEMIEQIPTKITDNYTGYTLVKDWEGNVLRYFEYENGEFIQELEVIQSASTARTVCTATDYYSCTKRANGNDDCTLDKTVITCVQQKEFSPPDLDGSQYPNGGSSATSCGSGYESNFFGECIRITCEPGYVLVGEKCVPQIEPCDTGNNLIDNNHLADVLPILWEASNPNAPLDQRFEQGAWIVLDPNGEYKAVLLLNFITTPCGLAPPENWKDQIPENAVAWLHTHPFSYGEDTRSICPTKDSQYRNQPSNPDRLFLLQIANHFGKPNFPGIVIDADKITQFYW
ncbi:MAG: hypothetical protein RIF46_12265, partial [Cyclobacteriaceae bacterium]